MVKNERSSLKHPEGCSVREEESRLLPGVETWSQRPPMGEKVSMDEVHRRIGLESGSSGHGDPRGHSTGRRCWLD